MKVIGFRASPKDVQYAILNIDGPSFDLQSVQRIRIPVSLSFPEKLNFIRKTVKDLIFEYQISKAGIRITESSAQNLNIERVSYEAILQEVLSCSPVKKYFVGQISNMSSKLGIDRSDFKKYIDTKKISYQQLLLNEFDDIEREAILVAIASINI
jgi:hypothetical protein